MTGHKSTRMVLVALAGLLCAPVAEYYLAHSRITSHLPGSLRPYRSLLATAINIFGSIFVRVGVLRAPTSASLIRKGCMVSNLTSTDCQLDYDDGNIVYNSTKWREGLDKYVDALANEANLTPLGLLVTNGMLENFLATRARLVHVLTKNREEIKRETTTKPIFIMGLPRTGTTFLHNLLAIDPTFRAPLHWEYVQPIAANGEPPGELELGKMQRDLKTYSSFFQDAHNMSVDAPEECLVPFCMEFTSFGLNFIHNVPSYWQWLSGLESHRNAIRWQHRVLQYLTWRAKLEGSDGGDSNSTLLLKTPWFLWLFAELVEEYPDARFIWTHRDPYSAAASFASFNYKSYAAFSDHLDPVALGQYYSRDFLVRSLQRSMEYRDEWHQRDSSTKERIFDIHLSELKSDPMIVVESVYEFFNIPLSANTQERMKAWLSKKKISYGHHSLNASLFGLSPKDFKSNVYESYCDRFDIQCAF